jgi:phage baseplate assembly protein W
MPIVIDESLMGRDIAFRQTLEISPRGDYATVTGLENLRLSIWHRLATRPGEYRVNPGYGVGLSDYVKAKITSTNLYELQHRITDNLRRDRRIAKINSVKAEAAVYGGQPGIKVTVNITAYGKDVTVGPYYFSGG